MGMICGARHQRGIPKEATPTRHTLRLEKWYPMGLLPSSPHSIPARAAESSSRSPSALSRKAMSDALFPGRRLRAGRKCPATASSTTISPSGDVLRSARGGAAPAISSSASPCLCASSGSWWRVAAGGVGAGPSRLDSGRGDRVVDRESISSSPVRASGDGPSPIDARYGEGGRQLEGERGF